MNWRKSLISLVAIILIIASGIGISSMLSSFEDPPNDGVKDNIKMYVRTEKVSYSTNNAKIIETGRLTSQQSVDLSAEVQGKIIAGDVILREGAKFKKGDLLVRIFDEEAKNNLKASKSRFLNSIAGILPDIKIDYAESYDKYFDFFNSVKINEPLPPLPALDTEKEKIFLASRNIIDEYYNIKSAEVRLSRYKQYAPFDGTFTDVFMEPGSVANPGVRIASMIRTDKLEMEVPVRIEDSYWINVGDDVLVSTKDRHTEWKGKVIRKSNFMDETSQAISLFVSVIPEKGKELYPGQYLRAEFASKTLHASMAIPRNAVHDKDKVFTVEEGKLKEYQIDILKVNETTIIFSGLPEGTDLVTEPLVNARDGLKAEILD